MKGIQGGSPSLPPAHHFFRVCCKFPRIEPPLLCLVGMAVRTMSPRRPYVGGGGCIGRWQIATDSTPAAVVAETLAGTVCGCSSTTP
jgi:hypothetical protein